MKKLCEAPCTWVNFGERPQKLLVILTQVYSLEWNPSFRW